TTSARAAQGTSRSRRADLVRERTSCPAARRRGTRRPPTYPVAPVTRHRTVSSCPTRPSPTVDLSNMGDDTYWGPDFASLRATDPEIADVLLAELDRLRGGLQLIASENLT